MSREWVLIGDLHAKKNNLEESEAIIDWCISQAVERKAGIVMLGDTLNDFGVLRVEALLFFDKIFAKFAQFATDNNLPVVILKGNHDENSQGTMTYLELWANRNPCVLVILKPHLHDKILFMPFIRDHETFKGCIEAFPSATSLVCHQEFDGCMYENGFYSPHGFKAEELPGHIQSVVSGHIHKTQQLGDTARPIIYVGIPRHLTKSDLGHTPKIAVTSDFRNLTYIDVPKTVATPFQSLTVTESFTKPQLKELMTVTDRSRFYIEIQGPKLFIKKVLRDHDWTGFKVKTNPTDEKQISTTIKESEGIRTSFGKYLFAYADKNGLGQTETKAVIEQLKELMPEMV